VTLRAIAITISLVVGITGILVTPADGKPVSRRRAVNDSKAATPRRAEPPRKVSSARPPTATKSSQLSATRGKKTITKSILPRWKALPRVTRRQPGLLFLLVDGSGSMSQEFAPGVRKADSVAEVGNNVLGTLVERFRSGNRVSDRLDVIALRYGNQVVGNALEGSLASTSGAIELSRLDSANVGSVELQDADGNAFTAKTWLRPGTPNGDTPMSRGFREALTQVRGWQRRPPGEHLLLGVHVSDGIFTDADPTPQLAELEKVARQQGGKLVMTNILLARDGSRSRQILFPTPAEAEGFDAAGKLLFRLSSPVPESLARQLGPGVIRPGARMMAYNADPEGLEKVFVAGSSTAIE
jgi:hypothetical protein